jgi:hypothetical protein
MSKSTKRSPTCTKLVHIGHLTQTSGNMRRVRASHAHLTRHCRRSRGRPSVCGVCQVVWVTVDCYEQGRKARLDVQEWGRQRVQHRRALCPCASPAFGVWRGGVSGWWLPARDQTDGQRSIIRTLSFSFSFSFSIAISSSSSSSLLFPLPPTQTNTGTNPHAFSLFPLLPTCLLHSLVASSLCRSLAQKHERVISAPASRTARSTTSVQ